MRRGCVCASVETKDLKSLANDGRHGPLRKVGIWSAVDACMNGNLKKHATKFERSWCACMMLCAPARRILSLEDLPRSKDTIGKPWLRLTGEDALTAANVLL